MDLWQKWNIGDTVEQIPPLNILQQPDYKFLDNIAKTDQEKRFSTGKHKDNKRPASKTYSDIKCLCDFIKDKAIEKGMDPSNDSPANINAIYNAMEPIIYSWGKGGVRVTQ